MAIPRDYILGFGISREHSVEHEEGFNLEAMGDLDMDMDIQIGLKKLFDHLSSRFAALHHEAQVAIERHDALDRDILARMQKIDADMMRRSVEGSTFKLR